MMCLLTCILVAQSLPFNRPEIMQFVRDLQIDSFFYTSSKEDTGLDDSICELVTKIVETEQVSFAESDPSRFQIKVKPVQESDSCCN